MSTSGAGDLGVAAKKQIAELTKRAVAVITERKQLGEDLTGIMNEAKDAGLDSKILRKAIKRKMADPAVLQTEEEMIDAYVDAMGDLPLFQAAA